MVRKNSKQQSVNEVMWTEYKNMKEPMNIEFLEKFATAIGGLNSAFL